MASRFNEGFWRLADPKISITSVASMAIGAALAARDGSVSWSWLLVMGLAMFCMEVAKNAWGDVYDYDSGTDLAVKPEDRTGFSGGKRVLVDNILTRGQTWGIALLFGATGVALGAMMVFLREPSIFWLGTVALVLGWSYHGPPLQLAYRGLGELDVVLCYGPLIAMATYALLTHSYSADVIWASMPLGLFIAGFLWVNEFPDYEADRSVGKNNLVVKLGRQRASRVFPLIYLLALALLALAVWCDALPAAALLGCAGAVPAAVAVWWTWQQPQTFYRHRPAQPLALLAFVLLSAGISGGVLLSL
ncbi:MAG: prenyltransferase [Halioglobus sp.]|nr:prenyltransferase [Halioglobus sp.]